MEREKEWDEFVKSLRMSAAGSYRATKEYEYQRQREDEIDELLTTNLTKGDKAMVDEVLFELGLASERETELIYMQGLRDGVWLLKHLGVPA